MIFSGCTKKTDVVPELVTPAIANPYPPLDADLKTVVALPEDKEGDDVYSSRAKNRKALKICRAEHLDVVNFYESLRKSKP